MKLKIKLGIVFLVIVVSVIAGIYYLLKPLEVETVVLESQDVYQYVEESGQVESQNAVVVTSLLTQKVDAIFKENGDFVNKGDLICRLNTDDLEWKKQQIMSLFDDAEEANGLNLNALKAQISDQKKLVSQLDDVYTDQLESQSNAQTLWESGAISQENLDQVNLMLTKAQTDLSRARGSLTTLQNKYQTLLDSDQYLSELNQELESVNYQISQSDIKSPAEGMIINQELKVGQIVSPQGPIGQVINPNQMTIVSHVLAEDSYLIDQDTNVKIEMKVNGENEIFEGKVIDVSPSAETEISSLGISEQRVAVKIKSDVMDALLKPGYKVNIKFVAGYVPSALVVPKTALFYDGDHAYVYVSQQGKAVQTQVTLGMETDNQIVVTQGLEQGQAVVINENLEGLSDGKRIR